MIKKLNWPRIVFLAGIAAMLIGLLDPLEGSVVIAAGSGMVTLGAYLLHDRYRKIFLISSILIAFGVIALFYISSLGSFEGNSGQSWWWGVFILPYPAGWLLAVMILVIKAVKNIKVIK